MGQAKNRLHESVIREKVIESQEVQDALADMIAALSIYNENHVTGDHLKSVIVKQLAIWRDHVEEDENFVDSDNDEIEEHA